MNSNMRYVVGAAVLVALAACKPSTTVGSPGTTAAPMANRGPVVPAGVTAATIAEGKTLYEMQANNCQRCHGLDAKGNTRGPNLADSAWVQMDGSYPAIVKVITDGVPAANIKGNFRFAMNPKGGSQMTEAQIGSVAAYIWSLSHAH